MRRLALAVSAILIAGLAIPAAARDGFGAVDTATGVWYLRDPGTGQTTSFYYGNPGDIPMSGDWDCDGVDTPGLYRQSDGFVYLRNSNSQGVANIRFFFGNPGDIPLAGDFDGDGCDTVSIYRPSEGRVYIINELGSDEGGLGAADVAYYFGNPGDKPFVGDFDGNGQETIGLHRESTGLVYFRLSHTQGVADHQFIFGNPGDKIMAGDWTGGGVDSVGLFRPSNATVYLRYSNTQGNADFSTVYGLPTTLPVAGAFGSLPGGGVAPVPPPPLVTFGNGTWRIGADIPSGTYRNGPSPNSCYAERLSGFGGTFDEIIANEFSDDQLIVTLSSGDAGFSSSRCSRWTNNLAPKKLPDASFGAGYWFVGSEIQPGLWRNSDSSGSCYWERLSGFSWSFGDIIANGFSTSIQTVRISLGDKGFNSSRCGTWTRIGS